MGPRPQLLAVRVYDINWIYYYVEEKQSERNNPQKTYLNFHKQTDEPKPKFRSNFDEEDEYGEEEKISKAKFTIQGVKVH